MKELLKEAYRLNEEWLDTPDFMGEMPDVADVAVAANNHVYLVTRRPSAILEYASDGEFLRSMGQDVLSERPHGITVGIDGTVYCVDEAVHAIARFDQAGQLLGWMGIPGLPSESGLDLTVDDLASRSATIKRAGPPFNRPTQLAVAPNGDLYVSDGYGNASVHRFAANGRWLRTWGGPGAGRGQFRCPHHVVVSQDDRVYVSDRENGRIQLFDLQGELLDVWELQRPAAIAIDPNGLLFVAEMGVQPGEQIGQRGAEALGQPPRITVLDPSGKVLDTWLGDGDPCAAGNFVLPHGIAVDGDGSVYVAELRWTYRTARQAAVEGSKGGPGMNLSPQDRAAIGRWSDVEASPLPVISHSLQKFVLR